jgi:hypothetical protein
MARNREFDDALDELKMLHDAKNHDYASAQNPYKNLEGVERIGIEAWRGIVIRLMDKFERVQQYCVNGELAIKSEGIEDTFKDIAVYSTLALILFRKEQEKNQELTELERGKGLGSSFFTPVDDKLQCDMDYDHPIMVNVRADEKKQEEERRKKEMYGLEPVDDKYNGDESYEHPVIAMRRMAEEQQEDEVAKHKKDFKSAIDRLEAERRARDN